MGPVLHGSARTTEAVRRALAGVPVELAEAWISEDVRPGRNGGRWMNALVRRR
jgi:hypothetical protein